MYVHSIVIDTIVFEGLRVGARLKFGSHRD